MNILDIVGQAIRNSFRSKLRTTLTVLAIFVGAFTLTLTNGVGTGIGRYVDSTVSSIGAEDVLSVTKKSAAPTDDGPVVYDPEAATTAGAFGGTVDALTPTDLEAIRAVPGVVSVEPDRSAALDFVRFGEGERYQLAVTTFVTGMTLELSAGADPDNTATEAEIALPSSFVKPLEFSSAKDAIGEVVQLALTDAAGTQSVVDATVVGVARSTLAGGSAASVNTALITTLADLQLVGAPEAQKDDYSSATARFDEDGTSVGAIKAELDDSGYLAQTVEDQIGAFKAVIDGIIGVLNAFAVIALVASGFGIINTLLMSVQERTREIGLMKAMGMAGGAIFLLFSAEAVFIGFLGSAIGSLVGIVLGSVVSAALSTSLLADLPGLSIVAFDPGAVIAVIVVVMVIAFLAGTLPASRAARQNPIDALRYE